MTALTPHFGLEELCATSVHNEDNTPHGTDLGHLTITAEHMELIRSLLRDLPIHVNSGFRSAAVNKAVGGVWNSPHLDGWACDFICPQFGPPLAICRAIAGSALIFDQLIEEGTWVHISFAPTLRRQVLTKMGSHYILGLPK